LCLAKKVRGKLVLDPVAEDAILGYNVNLDDSGHWTLSIGHCCKFALGWCWSRPLGVNFRILFL